MIKRRNDRTRRLRVLAAINRDGCKIFLHQLSCSLSDGGNYGELLVGFASRRGAVVS